MSKIPIILLSFIVKVGYFSNVPAVNVVDEIFAEIALRVFFSKKYWGSLPITWYTDTSVGIKRS